MKATRLMVALCLALSLGGAARGDEAAGCRLVDGTPCMTLSQPTGSIQLELSPEACRQVALQVHAHTLDTVVKALRALERSEAMVVKNRRMLLRILEQAQKEATREQRPR